MTTIGKRLGIFLLFAGLPLFAVTGANAGALAWLDDVSTTYAFYAVPVPTDLAIYAQFLIPTVTTTKVGPNITFTYDLPSELVGPDPVPVSLSGTITPGQPLQLTGDRGVGTCTLSLDKATAVCQIQYRDLGIDPAAVSSYLSSNVADANELKSRQQVASFFGNEPIGIVTYPVTP